MDNIKGSKITQYFYSTDCGEVYILAIKGTEYTEFWGGVVGFGRLEMLFGIENHEITRKKYKTLKAWADFALYDYYDIIEDIVGDDVEQYCHTGLNDFDDAELKKQIKKLNAQFSKKLAEVRKEKTKCKHQ